MTYVGPPSSFTTGKMDVEEHSFTWTIENFPVIKTSTSLIDAQKIYFSAGTKFGRPSNWVVFLQDEKKSIGIYFKVEEPLASDPTWKNVFAEMTFVIPGVTPITKRPKEVTTFSGGFGYPQFISEMSTQERLEIKHIFKLYIPSKSTDAYQPTVEQLQIQFATQAKKDLLALMLKYPNPGKKIKMISKDKKKFFVQKEILEAQSSVLASMMKNDKLEANSGVIKLPDISSKGLEVILTLLCTGKFHPAWIDAEVIVELTNAAAKYQLQDLLKFLDASLGKVCKRENVLALYKLAHQLSLKKAEVELLKFINEKGDSSPHFLPKEKSGLGSFFSRPFRALFARNEKEKWMKRYIEDRRIRILDDIQSNFKMP